MLSKKKAPAPTGAAGPKIVKRVPKKAANKKKITLERVIGCTVNSNAALAVNPFTDDIAYPAGCAVVLYNPKRNKQYRFLITDDPKAITCVAFSPDGKYLAAGETGHLPSVIVWELETGKKVAELRSHKYAVECLTFSPNSKYIVSVGHMHDGFLNIWDWENNNLAATNKVGTMIKAVAFSEDGSYFVTAGYKHVKFWYMDANGNVPKGDNTKRPNSENNAPIIEGKSALLGAMKESTFNDVACGTGKANSSIFCVTDGGILCTLTKSRTIDKWVNIKAHKVWAISVTDQFVAVAGTDGITRLFDPMTINHIATLPRPPPKGKADLSPSAMHMSYNSTKDMNDVFADTIAVRQDVTGTRVACIYADRSIFIWDIRNPKKIGKYRSFLAHSACIWDIDVLPTSATEGCNLPEGTFVTCSEDNTVRFWNIDDHPNDNLNETAKQRNAYSKDLLKVIYINPDNIEVGNDSPLGEEETHEEGIRCVRVSPDGQYVVTGDKQGNLRAHRLDDFSLVTFQEAHDAEILSLDFSLNRADNKFLLASGSRDRLIHIFDVDQDFELINTLDDHSASITAVKFAVNGTKLLSCSADSSIVFRSVKQPGTKIQRYHRAVVSHGTIFDMEADATQKFVITAGQEKRLNVWNIQSGKPIRSYKTDTDAGETLKVHLDPAGIFAATSSSDKKIRLYDFYSGTCLDKVKGHSEVVTGIKFSVDCRKLISVSADGCIFIWKLSTDLTQTMQERLAELGPAPLSARSVTSQDEAPLASLANLRSNNNSIPLHGPQQQIPNQQPPVNPAYKGQASPPRPLANEEEARKQDQRLNAIPEEESLSPNNIVSLNGEDTAVVEIPFSETVLPTWAKNRGEELPQQPPLAPKVKLVPKSSSSVAIVDQEDRPISARGVWAQRAEGYKLLSEQGDEISLNRGNRFTIEPSESENMDIDDLDNNNNIAPLEAADDQKLDNSRKTAGSSAEDDDDVVYTSEEEDNAVGNTDEEVGNEEDETVYYENSESSDKPVFEVSAAKQAQRGPQAVAVQATVTTAEGPAVEVKRDSSTTADDLQNIEIGDLQFIEDEEEEEGADIALFPQPPAPLTRKPFKGPDFLIANFNNLAQPHTLSRPTARNAEVRQSISSQYRSLHSHKKNADDDITMEIVDVIEKAIADASDEVQTKNTEDQNQLRSSTDSSEGVELTLKAERDALKRRQLSEEVNKTRKRLDELGLNIPKKKPTAKPPAPQSASEKPVVATDTDSDEIDLNASTNTMIRQIKARTDKMHPSGPPPIPPSDESQIFDKLRGFGSQGQDTMGAVMENRANKQQLIQQTSVLAMESVEDDKKIAITKTTTTTTSIIATESSPASGAELQLQHQKPGGEQVVATKAPLSPSPSTEPQKQHATPAAASESSTAKTNTNATRNTTLRLSRPVQAYRHALDSLQQSFEHCLSLFNEVQNVRMSTQRMMTNPAGAASMNQLDDHESPTEEAADIEEEDVEAEEEEEEAIAVDFQATFENMLSKLQNQLGVGAGLMTSPTAVAGLRSSTTTTTTTAPAAAAAATASLLRPSDVSTSAAPGDTSRDMSLHSQTNISNSTYNPSASTTTMSILSAASVEAALERYSDILVDLVRKKLATSNDAKQ